MKNTVTLFFILYIQMAFAQANQPWASYFSYNSVVDMAQSSNRVYAGAENALFSKSLLTDELKTITSVDGLKTETVSAIYYSTAYSKTFVGNTNGLLLVVNPDNTVLNVVDIIGETTIQPTRKKINHIFENQGKLYVSCDFGIVVYNMETMQFGDTYYLGPQGAEIPVLQAAVFNGYIYAATAQNGIRRALATNLFLNDFNQWTEFTPGQWAGITSVNDNLLFAANSAGTVFRIVNNNLTTLVQMPSGVLDLREANGYLVATSGGRVNVFNAQLTQVAQVWANEEVNNFTCASVVTEKLFIGTGDKGVFSSGLTGGFAFENITPDGPIRSNIFSIQKTPNFLWAVYGDYDTEYNPFPLDEYGVSKLAPNGWLTIPYNDLFGAKSIVDIAVNPNNENQVYMGSYFSGLLKIENDELQILYDNTNTGQNGLQTLYVNNPSNKDIRIGALTYDNSGNLWMTNNRITSPLKVLRAGGGWNSYDFAGSAQDLLADDLADMVIDKNNTKWLSSVKNGVIGFNETQNNKFIIIDSNEGNLPGTSKVQALAIDNNNQLWIGTNRGLRVLQGTDRFLSENALTTIAIIIEEEGVAQELLYEQSITDIVVDGSNNKWIATGSAGAFLVSPDGQRTIFHFTQQNSPLPSNTINDIEIDKQTGEVFFATNRGMVSYKGTSTGAADDLSKVYIYPNPVRPGFEGDVNISGLIDNANIKITDIEGNLVYETTSVGGTVLWDTKAFGRHKVASGVYMIFIASDDGAQTKVKKVMIVR